MPSNKLAKLPLVCPGKLPVTLLSDRFKISLCPQDSGRPELLSPPDSV